MTTASIRIEPQCAPVGYFVHHQGRGHAERCADLVNAMSKDRTVTIFSARDDIFPPLRKGVEVIVIPSLFEATGTEEVNDFTTAPDTVHCAPLGWPSIRETMSKIATWFYTDRPILMICDVSAEVAQLARLCSVPHVTVLQHGMRDDPGHKAAYDGAVGLLAPCDSRLSQTNWTSEMRGKTHFSGGIGVSFDPMCRTRACIDLGLDPDREVVLTITGSGGTGFGSASLAIGARSTPDEQWVTIGKIEDDWHATSPRNLRHDGWVDNLAPYLAAADVVIASTGNTTCHQILAAGKPWIAVPEWRYFDEQIEKALTLHAAGAALHIASLPSSVKSWRNVLLQAKAAHNSDLQRGLFNPNAARSAAAWIEDLISKLTPHAETGDINATNSIAAQ